MSSTYKPLRYPLGLPAGSIRAVFAIMVVGLFCALILITKDQRGEFIVVPPYLLALLGLVIVGFMAAQGRSINKRFSGGRETAPLGLPRWSVRIILFAALAGTLAYKITQDLDGLEGQARATLQSYTANPLVAFQALGAILIGYLVGHVLQMIIGLDNQVAIFQDIKAWIAMVAMAGMIVVLLVVLVINPNLQEQAPVDLSIFGSVLAGIISFYYSVRS